MKTSTAEIFEQDVPKDNDYRFLVLAVAYGLCMTAVLLGLVLVISPSRHSVVQELMNAATVQTAFVESSDIDDKNIKKLMFRQRTFILEALRVDPYNPMLWIKFAQHQDRVHGFETEDARRARDIARRLVPLNATSKRGSDG